MNAAETIAGISFERRNGLGVFRARKWTFRNVVVQGDIPVAFVSTDSITIEGYVLAACGQLGGAPAEGASPGNGGLGEAENQYHAGAGGGGFGSVGAKGGLSEGETLTLLGGDPGPAVLFTPDAPRGGGRGGGSSPVGLGGGVVFVASGTSIRIGTGSTIAVAPPGKPPLAAAAMGINAGGCGGGPSGQGGGAGGAIVLEAPSITVQTSAGLAANGGGGGAAGGEASGARAGTDGILGSGPAPGGIHTNGGGSFGAGGAGGAGDTPAVPGAQTTSSVSYGGGGGGGTGHIVVRTRDATVVQAAGAILSPPPVLESIQLL